MNLSLSARFHRESLDEARRYPLAVTPAGFEPSNMKQVGFDRFAEQIWTHEVRPRAERGVSDGPPSRTIPLSHQTPRALNEVPAASVIGV